MENSDTGKSRDGFIDRSKVRILLCDNDEKSAGVVLTLLCSCSYQVTSVRSPRQVIDALNAEGTDIDIILSEVNLPMTKGFKMLKYIMRDRGLRRIPVIMMSTQDEVPIVVKCLKFGAADYLVKPLRVNELLNLWTHMWRRRRMLGLAEKNILNFDLDLVASDPSDGNTNSITLFSDDTDDKTGKSTDPETCTSTHQEGKTNINTGIAPTETVTMAPVECQPDVPGICDKRRGQVVLFPKKNDFKMGESSAFITYVKSSTPNGNIQVSSSANEISSEHVKIVQNLTILSDEVINDIQRHDNRNPLENCSRGDGDPFMSLDASQSNSQEEFAQADIHSENDNSNDVPGCQEHTAAYPFYISGVMNQATMPLAFSYLKNLADVHNHANSTILSHYNHIPQCFPHIPGMSTYPYYPFMCLQPGQISTPRWPAHENNASNEGNLHKVDRRLAALMKFRQKRKERCFDKKIRYVNRKKLAERRPRVRGQFVRKVNGVNVDLNGQPPSTEDDQEEGEESDEEDQTAGVRLSPVDVTSVCP
ncbi:two-component response regulator-like APRR1 isoform X1 [Primulina huaijiensis]|uniref:two-component response regulator-like APRR1 isoform X1 n=2 Tax=Primulina huaijiensis TaxID=1492673 RepID=UPI003CC6DE94